MQKLEVAGHLLPGVDISGKRIKRFLEDLGPVCGMNVFNGPHVKAPDSYDPKTVERLGHIPDDVNGTLMWDDSGAQLYVFPREGNYFTLDIYTCKSFDAQKALQFVYDRLHPREDMVFGETNHNVKTSWTEYTPPGGAPVNPESAYLPEIDQIFDTDPADLYGVIAAGKRLEDIVGRAVIDGAGDRVAASYTPEQRAQLRNLHSDYEVAVDNRFMDGILSGAAISPDEHQFQSMYDRLSFMEGQAIGANDKKPIMHIGTGWPGTAIGLYRQFGTPVTCIEIDPIVATKSRDALEKLGLLGSTKIRIVLADGTDINPENYSAVIISAMVSNSDKAKILRNLRELATGHEDQLVVLRTPIDDVREFFYQPLGIYIPLAHCEITEQSPLLEDPIKSFVYRIEPFARVREGISEHHGVSARSRLQLVE